MVRAPDQRHRRAGARQHSAEVTPNGSSTNDRNVFNRHATSLCEYYQPRV
jgi:hypothetical protein